MVPFDEAEFVRRSRVAGLEMLARFERLDRETVLLHSVGNAHARAVSQPARPAYTGPERRSPYSAVKRAQLGRSH